MAERTRAIFDVLDADVVKRNSPRHVAWSCYSNLVTCRAAHVLRYRETGFHADLRRLSGHAFFACHQCEPSSFFFALFVTQPSPAVLCYAISKASYDEWSRAPEGDTPETQQLLHLLNGPDGESLNPRWKQPR